MKNSSEKKAVKDVKISYSDFIAGLDNNATDSYLKIGFKHFCRINSFSYKYPNEWKSIYADFLNKKKEV